jgi:hypothetical protein
MTSPEAALPRTLKRATAAGWRSRIRGTCLPGLQPANTDAQAC